MKHKIKTFYVLKVCIEEEFESDTCIEAKNLALSSDKKPTQEELESAWIS